MIPTASTVCTEKPGQSQTLFLGRNDFWRFRLLRVPRASHWYGHGTGTAAFVLRTDSFDSQLWRLRGRSLGAVRDWGKFSAEGVMVRGEVVTLVVLEQSSINFACDGTRLVTD